MKTVFTILGLFIATVGFSQSNLDGNVTSHLDISDLSISVTVDSAEDVESTFKMKDIKELLTQNVDVKNVTFEIICNGEYMSNGEKSTLSYKVNGNSKDSKSFLKAIKKMRKAAINYYKNN